MSDIQNFYKGHNVFITGGTGFIGKILVEKLLRSCPEVGNIFLLIRVKKGKTINDRLREITALPIFEPLRKINPDFEKKLVPVSGDAMKPGLGISAEDRGVITKEVSIIFHAAASTKFNDPLRFSVPINISSIIELISISRECTKLKAAIYISTAFSQCVHENIEEKVYTMPMSYEDISDIVQIIKRRNISEEDEVQFTNILMGNFPNTYVFTKSIAEGELNARAKDLPFSIFRFPITLATYNEPLPGWIDSIQGFNQGLIGISMGMIRVLNVDLKANLHFVPADFVCNALIACAWETSNLKNRYKIDELPVYNYASCKENPLTWASFREIGYEHGPQYMPMKAVYYPDILAFKSLQIYAFCNFFLHLIPALLGDVVLRILGRKPMLHKMYKKGNKLLEATRFFRLVNWSFESNRVQDLWDKLSEADKELIPFDLRTVDWTDMIIECWKGILKFVLKDNSSLEQRSRKYNTLRKIHRTIQILFITLVIWIMRRLYNLYL